MTQKEFKNRVLPYRDKLYRVALSLLSEIPEAEDAVQDTCARLWDIREELARYNSIEALAVTIIKNLCLDRLRSYRHRKKNNAPVEDLVLRSSLANPDKNAELSESTAVIGRLIGKLPDQQRLIMHLRDIEQYSYKEMEEITGLTRNNIRVQLSRARRKVRQEYLKLQNYENEKS